MNNAEKKEINDLLRSLIQIKSVNPPGNENQIADFIKKFLLKNNIHSELVPLEEGRSSVVAKIEGEEERNITLCGHLHHILFHTISILISLHNSSKSSTTSFP
ncbi:unnamed protein product [marine sediment metagenome]|uniref:Peptidase M20 dimerisation domain-containing protein n=1 Tax=marine sediment metagenome TaxID=412755 RepID=X1LPP6_9ZZZZ